MINKCCDDVLNFHLIELANNEKMQMRAFLKKEKEKMKVQFTILKGLEPDPNMTRRDPSPVIKINDTYYVYYSKTPETYEGYTASVWCASSKDGKTWQEECEVIPKGEKGAFDAGATFTPSTILANGYIYLTYTGVQDNFDVLSLEADGLTRFGMAKATCPTGPFEKLNNGEPFFVPEPAPAFDSHRIDDSCIIHRNNAYWMYYKGRQAGLTPKQTKMGIAIAQNVEGPYVRYENNPVLKSGHEVCVWPAQKGVLCAVRPNGPDGNTVQYAEDGIHFHKIGDFETPISMGPLRHDQYVNDAPLDMTWGICQLYVGERPYITRFDVVEMDEIQ